MKLEKVCQICCTSNFRQLSFRGVRDHDLPVALDACVDCGLLHFWPTSIVRPQLSGNQSKTVELSRGWPELKIDKSEA